MSIEKDHPRLSVRRQCRLLLLSRSTLYYAPVGESVENLALMRLIDQQFLETPWYGSRQMARWLLLTKTVISAKGLRKWRPSWALCLAGVVQDRWASSPHL